MAPYLLAGINISFPILSPLLLVSEEVGQGAIFTWPNNTALNSIRRIYPQCPAFSWREGRIFQTLSFETVQKKGRKLQCLLVYFQFSCFQPNRCINTVTGSSQVENHRGRLQGWIEFLLFHWKCMARERRNYTLDHVTMSNFLTTHNRGAVREDNTCELPVWFA